jgi:transcription elongation factor Elf1
LLAKEVLVRQAPEATADEVLGARYKPVPDGEGGVRYMLAGHQTVDFSTLGERFKDFGLKIDHGALADLNRIRTGIEHYYTNESRETVREAIAKAFPVVVDLFALAEEAPHELLGDAWQAMLEVRAVYERERRTCEDSFDNLKAYIHVLGDTSFNCPKCSSDLVCQTESTNTDPHSIHALCRSCGAEVNGEELVEHSLAVQFDVASYLAAKDGDLGPLYQCPECGADAYVLDDGYEGCALCEFILNDNCGMCGTQLIPSDAHPEDPTLCSWCYHMLTKDD